MAKNPFVSMVKSQNPLILNISNQVTMDFIANGLLAIGASPLMSLSSLEIEDLVKLASAVVINLGTLDEPFVELCKKACFYANQLQKPLILDPVGAGATPYRTQVATALIEGYSFAIIRGNASEISTLAGINAETKGVDTTLDSRAVLSQAKYLAKTYQTVIVISGETDFTVSQEELITNLTGSPLMPLVTGSGCLLSAVIAAFIAVTPERVHAAATATAFYGQCGEIAALNASGPGSFKALFLDALYQGNN